MPILSTTDVQVALKKLGYFDGPIDGDYYDDNFRDDLRRFQRDYPACGAVDGWYGKLTNAVLEPMLARVKLHAPADLHEMRRWRLTYYWVGNVRAHGAGAVPLYDRDTGNVLDRVAPMAFAEVSLQGSSVLPDGRLINVAGWKPIGNDTTFYKPVLEYARRQGWVPQRPGYAGLQLADDGGIVQVRTFAVRKPGPKGWPVVTKGIECDPFRTLAADNGILPRHDPAFKAKGGVVPAGTRVFILEMVGVRLPNGQTHDGWFTVNDTGGGIFGAHFDVFAGVPALAKQVRIPPLAHIWFEGIEERLSMNYAYGL